MLKKILYGLWSCIFVTILIWSLSNGSFFKFINYTENKTFDIRQSLIANSQIRKHNPDIVILAIDDTSYEYIFDKYGQWPLQRNIYAEIVNYLEAQKPQMIVFDLMFVKSVKNNPYADKELINVFKKYNNIYTAMNLDNQPIELREPIQLDNKLTIKPFVSSEPIEFVNCRDIIQGILDATANIGMINVSRSDDGVLRQMPLYLKYRNKYYPQLGYLVASDYLKKHNLTMMNLEKYAHNDASIILNWYGSSNTFENIPIYKVLEDINNNKKFDYNFKNKIIYIGATASSLFDIKTTPVDKIYPGVEVQATYVNNLTDGSLIRKTNIITNIIIDIILALLTILFVFRISSLLVSLTTSLTTYTFYILFTYYMMAGYNYWLNIIEPILIAFITFVISIIIKYLIKSRDFDEQYKLATVDGLTELFNHRYFQEQLQNCITHCKRYNTPLSLIMIDIDFFKKFNDNYGHQSGDAVLKQVACTLKKNVRSSDIVCRYGGEEMTIILPNTPEPEAIKIAQKLCDLISITKMKLTANREKNVTISLGVSSYTDEIQDASQLIENADKKLYNAKENGRNRVN